MPTSISSRFFRAGDSFLLDDADLKGGFRAVATLADRNAIALVSRRIGMIVFVQEDETEYTLRGGLGNGFWGLRPTFSGKLHSNISLINASDLSQFNPYTFQKYCEAALINWFNDLPSSQRVISQPATYMRVLCGTRPNDHGTFVGKELPEDSSYLGDCTFVYDAASSPAAVFLSVDNLLCVSSSLIPLGNDVNAAMNEYAERMAQEEGN